MWSQERIAVAERELSEAQTRLADEQAAAAAQEAALAEQSERAQADMQKLRAAQQSWADGEVERRGAAALLEEAQAEAARVKASPCQCLHCRRLFVCYCLQSKMVGQLRFFCSVLTCFSTPLGL